MSTPTPNKHCALPPPPNFGVGVSHKINKICACYGVGVNPVNAWDISTKFKSNIIPTATADKTA